MTIYYLSGPISSPDPAVMRANKQAFTEARRQLAQIGIVGVVDPCEVCAELEAAWPADKSAKELWRECMRLCIRALTHCHVIVMLPGYEQSKGARVELHNAVMIGMPAYLLHVLLGNAA